MTRKTKRYMIEAIDQATINREGWFTSLDIQESVSFLCVKRISISIIGKVLTKMAESEFIKIIGKTENRVNKYERGIRDIYPAKVKGHS